MIDNDRLTDRFDRSVLKYFARKYVWWKTPAEAMTLPDRVFAQVMNIGDYEDVQLLADRVSDEHLRNILTAAEIGQFNSRSWAYWHYRLGMASAGHVPPMPKRRLR